MPLSGELQCVADQVLHNLADAGSVSRIGAVCLWRGLAPEFQAFLLRHGEETLGDGMQQSGRTETGRMDVHLVGFQLVVVQQGVDQRKQMLGGTLYVAEIVLCAMLLHVRGQQFGVSHDGSHRCLDVVGDGEHQFLAGDEKVFGPLLGFLQLAAVVVAARDVPPHDDEEREGQHDGRHGDAPRRDGGLPSHQVGGAVFGILQLLFLFLDAFQKLGDLAVEVDAGGPKLFGLGVDALPALGAV